MTSNSTPNSDRAYVRNLPKEGSALSYRKIIPVFDTIDLAKNRLGAAETWQPATVKSIEGTQVALETSDGEVTLDLSVEESWRHISGYNCRQPTYEQIVFAPEDF